MDDNYRQYFAGKKITMMGLGLLGRGIGVAKFLAECGADLIITDLKTEQQLKDSLKKLKNLKTSKPIKFRLGEHNLEDFKNRDSIIKAASVPLKSVFISEAKKNKIPVKMDSSLFVELAPIGVKIIGVTGTRGKSTVTHLLYEILKQAEGTVFNKVYLGGNVRGVATLPLLKKVKVGDIVLMELDSWQLQGFGDAKISPNISLFTTFLRDHQNYYQNSMEKYFADKANIYRYQNKEDTILVLPQAGDYIKKHENKKIKSKFKVVKLDKKLKDWNLKIIGKHNLENISLAIEASRVLGIDEKIIKKAIENFSGVPGRLQLVREKDGIKYYNDTTATSPDGTLAALEALKDFKSKVVLLGGGADKELEYSAYVKEIKKNIKALALFKGVATDKILSQLGKTKFPVEIFDSMKKAFTWAQGQAKEGDVVLLSPGAASFGVFKNEFDRGDQFNREVNKLK